MTIKEIEQLSGMTRSNIRYYESEGFLTPERSDNGYRDYSPRDLQILQRIRLLRTLGMSLEDIKAVQEGRLTLSASLYQLENDLSQTQEQLDWAKETCRILRQDNVTYESLDASRYFDRLPPTQPPTAHQPLKIPWRRFFAREIDWMIWSTILTAILALVFDLRPQRISDLNWLRIIIIYVCVAFSEPILLYRFGTTPGKWFLGLAVRDLDGELPSLQAARDRTKRVLWWGVGLSIPIFSLIRYWKSYHSCKYGEFLPWEDETELIMPNRSRRKDILAAVFFVVLYAASLLVMLGSDRVPYRGPLTAENFCYNYNTLADYYDYDRDYLYPDGTFRPKEQSGGVSIDLYPVNHSVEFREKNGRLQSVTFTATTEGTLMGAQESEIMLITLAAVKTQVSALSDAGEKIVREMMGQPFFDYETTVEGITVTRDWEYTGYIPLDTQGILFTEEEDACATMTLTVELG